MKSIETREVWNNCDECATGLVHACISALSEGVRKRQGNPISLESERWEEYHGLRRIASSKGSHPLLHGGDVWQGCLLATVRRLSWRFSRTIGRKEFGGGRTERVGRQLCIGNRLSDSVHVQKRNQEIIRGPAVVDSLATLAPLYFYKKLATHRKASGYPSPVKTEMRKTCNLSGGCMVCKCVKSMACKTSWVEAA